MYYKFLRRNAVTMLSVINRYFEMLDKKYLYLLAIFSTFLLIPIMTAEASQKVSLEYDKIPNISFNVDRDFYQKQCLVVD